MPSTSDEALQGCLAAIRSGDTVQAFYELLGPLLGPRKRNWRDDKPFHMLANVLSTRGATIDGVREGQLEFLEGKGIRNPRIVSDRTLNRYLPDFGRKAQRGQDIDYEPWQLERASDEALATALLAARYFAVLRDRDFFAAIDGSSRPFYGLSYHYRKDRPERSREELTSAGRNTSPAFTNDSRTYAGTINKHEYLQMSLHLYDGKESLASAIRRGPATQAGLHDLVRILGGLPAKPLAVFCDRYFSNFVKSEHLRDWCDKNGVLLVMPAVKTSRTKELVNIAWHEGSTEQIRWNDEVVHWTCQPHQWAGHPTSRNNLLTLYFRSDPRKDIPKSDDDALQRLPDGLYALSFLINVEATAKNALWIWKQYSNRWSIENLFKRFKSYCGASFSQGTFLRDYLFHAGMILMATYALWRLHKRAEAGSSLREKDISHTRFFGAFRQEVIAALWQGQLKVTR